MTLVGGGSKEGGRLSPPQARSVNTSLNAGSYGGAIPRVWGTAEVVGNIVWYGGLVDNPVYPAVLNNAQQAYVQTSSFAVAFCEGPVSRIQTITIGGETVYDYSASPKSKYGVTIYLGTEVQTTDPTMEDALGAGNVPDYLGLCYAVFEDFEGVPEGIRAEIVQAASVEVGEVLADLAVESGLESEEYDFDCADGPLVGFVRTQREPAKQTMEPLFLVFALDGAEIDGQIRAIPRGGESLGTIEEGHLAARVVRGNSSPFRS